MGLPLKETKRVAYSSQSDLARTLKGALIDQRVRCLTPKVLRWYWPGLDLCSTALPARETGSLRQVTTTMLRSFLVHLQERGHNPSVVRNVSVEDECSPLVTCMPRTLTGDRDPCRDLGVLETASTGTQSLAEVHCLCQWSADADTPLDKTQAVWRRWTTGHRADTIHPSVKRGLCDDLGATSAGLADSWLSSWRPKSSGSVCVGAVSTGLDWVVCRYPYRGACSGHSGAHPQRDSMVDVLDESLVRCWDSLIPDPPEWKKRSSSQATWRATPRRLSRTRFSASVSKPSGNAGLGFDTA